MNHPKDHHKCFARLACVKHAASVHPEPGSNSLKKFVKDQNLAWLIFYPVLFTLVLFFKNYILLNFQGYVTVQLSRFSVISFALLRQLLYSITTSFVCQPLFSSFFERFKSYNCLNCSSSSINFIGDSEYNTPLPPDCQLLFSSFFQKYINFTFFTFFQKTLAKSENPVYNV